MSCTDGHDFWNAPARCWECDATNPDFDGAPATREEVTAGYVNPTQERMATWSQKQEAKS